MNTKLSIFCGRVIEAGWLAAAVSVPIFFNIYTARTFEPDKITLLRSIVSLMALAWIIMVVEQGASNTADKPLSLGDRLRGLFKIPLFLPTYLLVMIYIISTIFSISPNVSLWGSYQRLEGTYSALSYIVVFAMIAGNLRTREQIDRLVTTIIVTSIPVALYGIVQRYGLDPLPWAGDVTGRVAAHMGNAIFVASYLIMIIPLTLVRLVGAMTAIIQEEETSWGHTILAAVYIFALAIQFLTILFSKSRGPQLGVLGGIFVMGLLLILILRQLHADSTRLSIKELLFGIGFAGLLALAGGLGGGVGYFLGRGLESALLASGYQIDNAPLLGAALGGLLGFLGLYVVMAATERGWRWLWASWVVIAIVAIGFVLALNVSNPSLDPYLTPLRETPYLGRLSEITATESGTGKVRVLIWDAAMKLIAPHGPLGIEGDNLAKVDRFNILRPLIGYGPESMFNAFAYVYPPELAHVEVRGSSADRSHNETMDSLVITGVLGFLAFYFVMVSLFYYILNWLGWTPDKAAKQRLIGLLILGGIIGAIIPYLADSRFTFMPLGLPFGLITGAIIYLVLQGVFQGTKTETKVEFPAQTLLLIGLLGAIVGHFIEVHFVFSIAATYTYFWIYAGLIVALARINGSETTSEQEESSEQALAQTEPVITTRRAKKRRGRRSKADRKSGPTTAGAVGSGFGFLKRESWEIWVASQGLAMAFILMISTFNFITPQFVYSLDNEKSRVFFWMLIITWHVGMAITLAITAIRWEDWGGKVSLPQAIGRVVIFGLSSLAFPLYILSLLFDLNIDKKYVRAILIYSVTSLGFFWLYSAAHTIQFGQRITINTTEDVIRAANVLSGGLVTFYIFLLLLMVIIAITLSWQGSRRLAFWRSENWWLYPPLVLAIVAVIWFKNVDVVRADVYLKEGERYRNNKQWEQAIALHEKSISLDEDEDFYYLMLALDYQLMAQDSNLDNTVRQYAWQQGEKIALEARQVNPYNPDNTGNMGRYYFTLGQIFNAKYYQDALDFFQKAAVLAPSNVLYHNLWAQTYYVLQNYDVAIGKLQTSISIDPNYAPTWIQLGDTYAALGDVDQALMAHTEALKFNSRGSGDGLSSFADQFLDQRLNFYISGGRTDDLITALQEVVQARPNDEARISWIIGHMYNLQGQPETALPYFEKARALGDSSPRTIRELANTYLALSSFEQAIPLYESLVESNAADVESHSALAFIYAQLGRLDEAIQHNHTVLQHLPNDYDSLKNLAILYKQNGQLQEALTFAQQAQTAAPESEKSNWNQFIADVENQIAANN